jgi:prepilin-type N-terminal cleavage/methylation domain-containing protein
MNNRRAGFTLVELMAAVAVASIIMLGLAGVISQALHSNSVVHAQNNLNRDAHFALQQITRAIENSHRLLLPLADNAATDWPENIREQTEPASAPIGSSSFASAVLAVALAHDVDLDKNGIADADNDGDGRFDEDPAADNQNDSASGIYLIDDDGNGEVDESNSPNNDEQASAEGEDPLNALDDDGDSAINEDLPADINGDGCSGVCGVDDDGDGAIDEGGAEDDDEDGTANEDGYDPVVFYLDNGVLKKRTPTPWDENGSSGVDGRDFIVSDIAENVTRFRVERVAGMSDSVQMIDIILELRDTQTAQSVSLHTRRRVGGAL